MRKRCVRPEGTVAREAVSDPVEMDSCSNVELHTVSVVMEVRELVTPLSDDSQRVLEESNHDQKPAYRGHIPGHKSQLAPTFSTLVGRPSVAAAGIAALPCNKCALTALWAPTRYPASLQFCSSALGARPAGWGHLWSHHFVQRCRRGSDYPGGSQPCRVSEP